MEKINMRPLKSSEHSKKILNRANSTLIFVCILSFTAQAQQNTNFSLQASKNAAPHWVSKNDRIAPQISAPRTHFLKLRATESGDVHGGVFLCNVQIHEPKRWDSFAAPDLDVTLSIGKGENSFHHTFHGPQDTSVYTFSIPQISLNLRTKVSLSVVDRDIFQNEFIGSDMDVFAGSLPLVFSSNSFSGECRVLKDEALEYEKKMQLGAARQTLQIFKAEKTAKNFRPYLGLNPKKQERLHQQIKSLAGLSGWQNEKLQSLIEDENKFIEDFHQNAKSIVSKIFKNSKKTYQKNKSKIWSKDRLRISNATFSCEPDKVNRLLMPFSTHEWAKQAECVFIVKISKRTGGTTLVPPYKNTDMLRILESEGHIVELHSIGFLPVTTDKVEIKKNPKENEKESSYKAYLKRGAQKWWVLVPETEIHDDKSFVLRVPGIRKVQNLWIQER